MNKIQNFKSWNRRSFKASVLALVAGLSILSSLVFTRPAQAHCDSYQGPVVQAAQKALDTGNVKLILAYVQADDETELTAAFNHTVAVRKLGGEAKKLSEQYFFETAVRLHRQGEGAAYTGLKDEPVPAAIQSADKALQTGNLDSVNQMLTDTIKKGVAEKYAVVVAARANAKKLGTVEALREQAEAELIFEKYVYGIYTSASAAEVEAEGAGHTH